MDNCADAIVLAGLKPGIDGEVFNVVDDDLISSRKFLRLYKKNVRKFKSFYLPHFLSYSFCYLWESYSEWSQGQLPPAFNRRRWQVEWKRTRYSNQKLKTLVGWSPKVSMADALNVTLKDAGTGTNMLKVALVGCGKIADSHASEIQRIKGCGCSGL